MDGLLSDKWAWRSDMNALAPGYPEMRNSQVRNPTDNVRPMAYDALSALPSWMGVSHPMAQEYAAKIGAAAPWTPPGFMADAAGGIGGKLHEGKPAEAALNAYLLFLTGKLGQVAGRMVTPAPRDHGMAAVLNALHPNSAPVSRETSRTLSKHGGMNDAGMMELMTNMIPRAANDAGRIGLLR